MSQEIKEREPMFSPKNMRLITNPFNKENPITVQVLGICSALAVTVKFEPAFMMALSVIAVAAIGNTIISVLRNTIPSRIRIIVQLVVVALLVILVDQILKAFSYDVSKQLSVFVGLIITNCILMGRYEAFAMQNKPWPSFLDGLGNGFGYGLILLLVAAFREIFSPSGSLTLPFFGTVKIVPQAFFDMGYVGNGMAILPPMALISVAIIIWIQRSRNEDLQEN
jgi:Na+-transporting NADH:ubiquinone oxidoreductase subunit D